MFRSRKKRRRPNRSNRSRSIRLGVELMEGRMMLSGTGIAPVQPTLDLTQYSFTPIKFNLTSDWFNPAELLTDGGYANSSDAAPLAFLSDVRPAEAVLTYNWHGTSVAGIIGGNGFAFDHADIASNTATFRALSTSLIDSDGLVGQQIDVIPTWNNSDSPVINLQPVVLVPSPSSNPSSSPSPNMPSVSEGGAIPIHAIFADFRQDSHLASGVKAISSRAAETSIDSLAATRQLSAPDNAIAGEWARAMVFEIAGGEPTTGDSQSLDGQPTTTSDSDKSLQHSKPLSSVEASQQHGKLASHHTSAPANEGSLVGEPGQPQSAQLNGQVASIEAQLVADGKLPADLAAPGSDGLLSGYNPSGAENPNIAALAAAAVFDQLGQASTAVIESAVDGKSWVRSIGTSPLLMVLALERIAAFNSRRATRESRIAAAKKPLRLRS